MIGAMQIMDPTGHTTVKWDPENDDDVKQASETFDVMKAKGYNAFTVDRSDRPGKRLAKFDPSVSEMILIPQLVGG